MLRKLKCWLQTIIILFAIILKIIPPHITSTFWLNNAAIMLLNKITHLLKTNITTIQWRLYTQELCKPYVNTIQWNPGQLNPVAHKWHLSLFLLYLSQPAMTSFPGWDSFLQFVAQTSLTSHFSSTFPNFSPLSAQTSLPATSFTVASYKITA